MNQKTQRLSMIRKIIRSEYISSQEELIKRLEEYGVLITQSTLSRDLKYMHVARKGDIGNVVRDVRRHYMIITRVVW